MFNCTLVSYDCMQLRFRRSLGGILWRLVQLHYNSFFSFLVARHCSCRKNNNDNIVWVDHYLTINVLHSQYAGKWLQWEVCASLVSLCITRCQCQRSPSRTPLWHPGQNSWRTSFTNGTRVPTSKLQVDRLRKCPRTYPKLQTSRSTTKQRHRKSILADLNERDCNPRFNIRQQNCRPA